MIVGFAYTIFISVICSLCLVIINYSLVGKVLPFWDYQFPYNTHDISLITQEKWLSTEAVRGDDEYFTAKKRLEVRYFFIFKSFSFSSFFKRSFNNKVCE